MKPTITAEELKAYGGFNVDIRKLETAHGNERVSLAEATSLCGIGFFWNLAYDLRGQLTNQQKADLWVLGADYAERAVDNFEKCFPKDKRPQEAIAAVRAYAELVRKGDTASIEFATVSAITTKAAMRAEGAAGHAASSTRFGHHRTDWAAVHAAKAAMNAARVVLSESPWTVAFAADEASDCAWMLHSTDEASIQLNMLIDMLKGWDKHEG